MKKTIAILLVAVLAASSVFAGFSGKATVGLGVNHETKAYGFTNGTGFDVNVDLTTAESEKVAEGDIYAGIKATMGVKVANKVAGINKGTSLWDSADKGTYGVGLFLKVAEAYVAGDNWKVSITGTQGATSYAKSFTTHKEAVKDAFGNETSDTKDVADDLTGDYGLFNKAPGVTAEVAGYKVSLGFNGTKDATTTKNFKYSNNPSATAVTKGDYTVGKYYNYNVLVETPEYDLNGVSLQVAAGASRKLDNYVPADKWGEAAAFNGVYMLPKFYQLAVNTSAKVGYSTDKLSVAVAADYDAIKYGEKETQLVSDKLFNYFDSSVKVVYAPVTVDAYYAINGYLADMLKNAPKSNYKLLAHTLSAQVTTDLAAFDLPVKVTVWGKDVLNTKDFGAKAEVTVDAFKVSANGGYVIDATNTKAAELVGKYYVGADAEYKNDLFTAKAGVGFNSFVGKNVKDAAQLTASASIESDVVVPGATLKLAYSAADKDQNILKGQTNNKAYNLGKLEATCTIKF